MLTLSSNDMNSNSCFFSSWHGVLTVHPLPSHPHHQHISRDPHAIVDPPQMTSSSYVIRRHAWLVISGHVTCLMLCGACLHHMCTICARATGCSTLIIITCMMLTRRSLDIYFNNVTSTNEMHARRTHSLASNSLHK